MPRLSGRYCHLPIEKNIGVVKPFFLFKTSVISRVVSHFECKHTCLAEKNVATAIF